MNIRATAKYYFRKLLQRIQSEDQKLLILQAGLVIKKNRAIDSIENLAEVEFKVFSQYGEDGVIQYLLSKIDVPHKIFIEFGVEDYTESNTRFLLVNNNWKGLVIDGSSMNIKFIKSDEIYWRHNLTAIDSFITKGNINSIFSSAGISGDIGLLSVDIDGNDYWVWNEINNVQPRIVIAEYNSVLGPDLKITVPYSDSFVRRNAHYSDLYFGTSLSALCDLAEKKGYYFVGCNSNGNNAFFIRNDLNTSLKKLTAKEGYVCSQFRESRNEHGKLTYKSGDDRIKEMLNLKFFDLNSNQVMALKDLLKK